MGIAINITFKYKIMKNTIKILLLFVMFSACNKINLETNNSKTTNIEVNAEAIQFYEMYNNADYSFGVIYDNNYGVKSSLKVEGDITNDLIGNVDNFNFSSNRPNDVISIKNDEFSNLYGKEVSIKLSDSEKSKEFKLYSPRPISFTAPKIENTINIERTGNDLKWIGDDKSLGVLVRYVLYDVDRFSNEDHKVIDSGNEFISDNGSFNIDYLLENSSVKSLEITLTRANGVNFINRENKNVFFTIQSTDAHYYILND